MILTQAVMLSEPQLLVDEHAIYPGLSSISQVLTQVVKPAA